MRGGHCIPMTLAVLLVIHLLWYLSPPSPQPEQATRLKRGVVIAANENPFYSFFVPLVTRVWRERIGVEVVIALFTKNVNPFVINATRAMGGTPVLVESELWPPPLGTARLMQNGRIFAASIPLDEDMVLTTSDADIFPLNRGYFMLPENMTHRLVVHGNHPGTAHMKQYPLCYLSLTVREWRAIMQIDDGMSLHDALLRHYHEYGTDLTNLYFDQEFFYRQLQVYLSLRPGFKVTLVPWPNNARLDFRVDRNFDYVQQPPHTWVDSPALRPGFTPNNWPRLKEGLLKHLFDPVTLEALDKYRDAFIDQVMLGDAEAKDLKDGFGRSS